MTPLARFLEYVDEIVGLTDDEKVYVCQRLRPRDPYTSTRISAEAIRQAAPRRPADIFQEAIRQQQQAIAQQIEAQRQQLAAQLPPTGGEIGNTVPWWRTTTTGDYTVIEDETVPPNRIFYVNNDTGMRYHELTNATPNANDP